MNNEGELKLEFENFIEDLVRDVVKDTMKSLVYEDLKKLYDEYYKNASNLKNTIEKGKNYNKEIDNIISKLNISSKNINSTSTYLNNNTEQLIGRIKSEVRVEMEQLVSNINISTKNLHNTSIYLNDNIEQLTEKIKQDVKVELEQSIVKNKKNMDDLSNEMRFIRGELLKNTESTQRKIDNKLKDTDYALQILNTSLTEKTDNSQKYLANQIYEFRCFNKKISIATITLGIANIALIGYVILSSLGVM